MVGIDEEKCLLATKLTDGWLEQSRYGCWLYERFFTDSGRYVPFFTDFMGLMLWNISGTLFLYLFSSILDYHNAFFLFVALGFYDTIPVTVGQIFGFTMMVIPVSFGMVLVAVTFMLTLIYVQEKKLWQLLVSVLLMNLAVGIYQTMLNLYITAIAGYCLFSCIKEKSEDKKAKYGRVVIAGIIISAVSVLLYFIINHIIGIFIEPSTYLSENFIGWTTYGLKTTLRRIVMNILAVTFALPEHKIIVFGGVVVRVVVVLYILCAVYRFVKETGWKNKLVILFWEAVIPVAPFTLFVLMGSYTTPGRILLALSLSCMLEILYVAYWCRGIWNIIYSFVMLAVLIVNAYNINLMYYSEYMAYKNDVRIAEELISDIREIDSDADGKALVVIGNISYESALPQVVTLGQSIFEWDDGNLTRIIPFLEIEGLKCEMPTEEQINSAVEKAADMPEWPAAGSIVSEDGYIVVYLSEPTWQWYHINLGLE
jgi:hypothetical protein